MRHRASSMRAIRAATLGRPGPVALECAIDTWPAMGEVEFPAIDPVAKPPVDAQAVEAAAQLLGRAERPLIVVGSGAQGAAPELRAVAEMLQAPVVSFRRGRGVMPSSHPLAVSFTEGHRFWEHADAVLAVGTRLYWQQSAWGVDASLPVVRIDIDPAEPARFPPPGAHAAR